MHAATQAPQPMHAPRPWRSRRHPAWMGMLLASGAWPVLTETKPPAAMMRSKALRSTTRSLMTGNAEARHGSIVIVSPSLNLRMWSWHTVPPRIRPVRHAVHHEPARAADALAAVGIERNRILAGANQRVVDDVEHLEERHVGTHVRRLRSPRSAPPHRASPGARLQSEVAWRDDLWQATGSGSRPAGRCPASGAGRACRPAACSLQPAVYL